MLTRTQREFRDRLVARTGLDPKVVGAWMLAEESGGAARGYERKGYFNYLNVGAFDSGFGSIYHDPIWRNPNRAADATADFLRGRRFGASGGIRRILRYARRSPGAQIQAIAGSGWASSGYNGGSDLRTLYGQVEGGPSAGRMGTPSVGPAQQTDFAGALKAALSAAPAGPRASAIPQAPFFTATKNLPDPRPPEAAQLAATIGPPPKQPAIKLPGPMLNPGALSGGGLPGPGGGGGAGAPTYKGLVTLGRPQHGVNPADLTHPTITAFLHALSATSGHDITVGTGKGNHSPYTISGNPSEHGFGNAADIPTARGAQNVRLGQAALITAGVPRAQAHRMRGGIYNIVRNGVRYQIIFGGNFPGAGDHTDHVHVGAKHV